MIRSVISFYGFVMHTGLVISNATHILYKPYSKARPYEDEAPSPPTVIFSQVIMVVKIQESTPGFLMGGREH